ncbi:MAG TPA: DUF72 domain-containing protein [Candidatus Thermoplasmatota archaeon]|nr:DUF72 domain-containing protein [Candidatus Thermoplasmatota archaeon]
MTRRLRIGCSGWGYDDWLGVFYASGTPAGEYLERYARVFDVVEVDSSYYRMPTLEQTERWARATPPGFTFALKFPGEITHEAKLENVEGAVAAFLRVLEPLRRAGKLGPLLAQLPASFRAEKGRKALEAFLPLVPRDQPLAVELRHASWWTDETYKALEAAGAALAWSVNADAPTPPVATADFLYVRFIGDRELTRFDRIQRDGSKAMEEMRERIAEEGRRAGHVFLFANNHYMGFGPGTAARLAEVLGEPAIDLAPAARPKGQRGLGDF